MFAVVPAVEFGFVMPASMSIDVSSMPFPAIGILSFPICCSGSHVGDRPHHGVADAGIVQRVAGAFDDANFGLAPQRAKRVRGRGRAQQVVAALHDDAGNAFELAGFRHQLVRRHEAVVGKVMRFHERRRRQGARRIQRPADRAVCDSACVRRGCARSHPRRAPPGRARRDRDRGYGGNRHVSAARARPSGSRLRKSS